MPKRRRRGKQSGFDPPLEDQLNTFVKGIDDAFSAFVLLAQSKFSAGSPVDSGRLASSWYISKDKASSQMRGPKWAKPGQARVEVPEYTGKITFSGDWYITNNLPYAEIAALGGGGRGPYVGSKPASTAWYEAIRTHLNEDWQRQLRKFLREPPPRNFRPS